MKSRVLKPTTFAGALLLFFLITESSQAPSLSSVREDELASSRSRALARREALPSLTGSPHSEHEEERTTQPASRHPAAGGLERSDSITTHTPGTGAGAGAPTEHGHAHQGPITRSPAQQTLAEEPPLGYGSHMFDADFGHLHPALPDNLHPAARRITRDANVRLNALQLKVERHRNALRANPGEVEHRNAWRGLAAQQRAVGAAEGRRALETHEREMARLRELDEAQRREEERPKKFEEDCMLLSGLTVAMATCCCWAPPVLAYMGGKRAVKYARNGCGPCGRACCRQAMERKRVQEVELQEYRAAHRPEGNRDRE